MSVGEALVYGLLGGTKAASEHYVTDWRERTKEARNLASQKEGWEYQENLKRETAKELADYERAHKDKTVQYAASDDGKGVVPIAPDAKTGEMPIPVAQMTGDKFSFYGTGKSSKSGGGLLGGLGGSSNLTTGKMKLLNSSGQSVEVSVRQDKGGGLSFPEIGMDGGVTWRKLGKDISKDATAFGESYAYEILSDTGLLGSHDIDQLFKDYGVKTKTELEQKLIVEGQAKYIQQQLGQPVNAESAEKTAIPSQTQKSNLGYTPKGLNLVKTDARYGELGQINNKNGSISTEFSITENIPELGGWVNIPTLVKGQNDLSFLESGKLTDENFKIAVNRAIERVKAGAKLPTYNSLEEANRAAETRSYEEKMRPFSMRSDNMPAQLPQTTGAQLTAQHILDARKGNINPDTFKQVYGEEAYNRYVQPVVTDQTIQPEKAASVMDTETPDAPQAQPHEVGTIIPGHFPDTADYFKSWLKPDYATHKKQQEKLEREYNQRKKREALKQESDINALKSDRDNIIATMNDPGISMIYRFKLADKLAEINGKLNKLTPPSENHQQDLPPEIDMDKILATAKTISQTQGEEAVRQFLSQFDDYTIRQLTAKKFNST